MTRVSVVVCSYNSADTLGAALDSALDQSFPSEDYEVLLVDDGSTDQTLQVAEAYGERHLNFRYLRFPANEGLVAASNYGLQSARGRYFIRLDADDIFHRDILSCCVEPLDREESDFVYCDRYEVNLENGTRCLVTMDQFNLFELIAIGTMLRTELVRRVGGYRPLFWEEYDLYLRYLQRSQRPPTRVPRALYFYSKHATSMTADKASVREGWEELRKLWGEEALVKFGWSGIDEEA